jgi:hypothetical protein
MQIWTCKFSLYQNKMLAEFSSLDLWGVQRLGATQFRFKLYIDAGLLNKSSCLAPALGVALIIKITNTLGYTVVQGPVLLNLLQP